MIIKKITLNPFAGFNNFSFSFNDNLTVVLGKNEAGKSTIVNAIKTALFLPNKIGKRKLDRYKNFLPISGSDTINLSLEYLHQQELFSIKRSLGQKNESLLLKGNTEQYSNIDTIQQILNDALVYSNGTYENILIISQTLLNSTVDTLENSNLTELSEILRQTSINNDGVNISELQNKLNDKINAYSGNWDFTSETPRDGKGINNPHKRGNGKIIDAFYEWKKSEQQLNQQEELEQEIENLSQKIKESKKDLSEHENFITNYKTIYEGSRKRERLVSKQENLKRESQQLRNIYDEWNNTIPGIEQKGEQLKEKENSLTEMRKELEQAEENEKYQSLRETFKKAKPIKDEVNELKAKLQKQPIIDDSDLKAINKQESIINNANISLSAQKLKTEILAKKDTQIMIGDTEENLIAKNISKGDREELELSGKVIIDTPDVNIVLRSLSEDVDSLQKKISDANSAISETLKKYNVSDKYELLKQKEEYDSLLNVLRDKEKELELILGNNDFEELEKKLSALPEMKVTKSIKELSAAVASLSGEINNLKKELKEDENKISEWIKEYKDLDALDDKRMDIRTDLKKISEDMDSYGEIPSEFDSDEEFIKAYERKEKEYIQVSTEYGNLVASKKEKEAFLEKDDALSSEELLENVKDAEADFYKAKREGEYYRIILEELNRILAEAEQNPFGGLKKEVSELLKTITLNKYEDMEFDEVIPSSILYKDGNLNIHQLSTGTRDILALAIRLGMAKYYLSELDGFIVMDDPLVNLDPERQKAAANVIKQVASQKQVILFTCHPNHAELFGNEVIQELN